MTELDLLITNAHVVTMNPEREVLRDGAVAIREDRIEAVGSMAELGERPAAKVIDAGGKVALPGFVNAHTHATHNLQRGGPSDDRVLYDWLVNSLNPSMKAYRREDVALAARLYCLEAIRSGITTFVDNADYARHAFHPEEAIGVFQEFGMRAIYGRLFFDTVPEELGPYFEAMEEKEPEINHDAEFLEDAGKALADTEALIDRYHGSADGRISVWPAPAVAITTTKAGLLGARDLAKRKGTMLTIHVAQSSHDRIQAAVSSVEYLAAIGFLGPWVLANHMVQVEYNDLRILRDLDVRIAHNPVSNMYVADGIAPVAEMNLAGITVGIGTDDCNANQSVSVISDMKFAALAQKVKYGSSAAMTAEKVLEMATIDGARAIGMEAEIGSLEPGKKADLSLVDLEHPQTTPWHNAASALVYQAYGNEVDTVLVDGRILMEGRRLVALGAEQEAELLVAAQTASDEVLERAGMQKLRDRPWTSIKGV
jgi:atrazine chlorohydrolase/5-methylthioadenosine/S-adenosylhomocysteine deaminase/melamine deaminase